jgi:hypothetical protein
MMEGTVPIPNVGSNPTPVITKEGEIIMPMVIPVLFLIIVGISTVFLVFFKLVDGPRGDIPTSWPVVSALITGILLFWILTSCNSRELEQLTVVPLKSLTYDDGSIVQVIIDDSLDLNNVINMTDKFGRTYPEGSTVSIERYPAWKYGIWWFNSNFERTYRVIPPQGE